MVMKSVTLPLVYKDVCQDLLRKTRLSQYFVLHPSFICAGGDEGVDACKGDGGGPLACRRKDDPTRYLQVGITSWGIGCGNKDVPGVYADVAYHHEWIENQMKELVPVDIIRKDNVPSTTISSLDSVVTVKPVSIKLFYIIILYDSIIFLMLS